MFWRSIAVGMRKPCTGIMGQRRACRQGGCGEYFRGGMGGNIASVLPDRAERHFSTALM